MMFAYSYPHKICDRIHGFIRFNDLEKKVIDSRPFQRLRYIHQMGTAYLIYPGATHTRFEHSLGVMELASRSFDSMMRHYQTSENLLYWRQILRIAALCHDMGHLPFSHTAEKSLLGHAGHEQKTIEFVQSDELRTIWKEMEGAAEKDILKLAVGIGITTPWEQVLAQVITDDNFGADRIDYLIRDAEYTGVGYGHLDHHQLIDTMRILPKEGRLSIGVSFSGVQSVESLWIARYLMYARVYHHPKARLYAFHMDRFMRKHYLEYGFPTDVEGYLRETDYQILSSLTAFADLGDEDAKALLKEGPAFVDLTLELGENQIKERKDDLIKKFDDKLAIDIVEQKEKERNFPILKDGKVISSLEGFPFLQGIPLGRQTLSCFVDPSVKLKLINYIKSVNS